MSVDTKIVMMTEGILAERYRRPAFVLAVRWKLRVWPMHSRHQWVVVGIYGEHRVALENLPGFLVDPGIPKAGESPRPSIQSQHESPPDVAAGLPTRFIEGPRWNDAALPL